MISQREMMGIIATEALEAGSMQRQVRLYRVRGICLVPTECTMVLEATSPEQAVQIALASKWQEHVDQNGGDDRAAFDWMPDAEEVQSPNPTSTTPVAD